MSCPLSLDGPAAMIFDSAVMAEGLHAHCPQLKGWQSHGLVLPQLYPLAESCLGHARLFPSPLHSGICFWTSASWVRCAAALAQVLPPCRASKPILS